MTANEIRRRYKQAKTRKARERLKELAKRRAAGRRVIGQPAPA